MPKAHIGKLEVWVTPSGLSVCGEAANNSHVNVSLTAAEAVSLLQLLSASRQTLYHGVSGYEMVYACPSCTTMCQLEPTATGYYGGCGQCGNDFTLDMAGVLQQQHYG